MEITIDSKTQPSWKKRCKDKIAMTVIFFGLVTLVYYFYLCYAGPHLSQRQQMETSIGAVAEYLRSSPTCAPIISTSDIDTTEEFRRLDFESPWIRLRHFWDNNFEARYQIANQAEDSSLRPPLKVIVIPHSHNDPGWLMTFEEYYSTKTKSILSNMVRKLTTFRNMTFIWSEISFLSRWWDDAHHTEKDQFLRLLAEGRLEIVTGGWVMTDEATTHIYATIDQLIEGHQWVKNNLGMTVTSGWSIDPFGHGSTMPYLLKLTDVGGTVIQRIHYAWKKYMAETQKGDFFWRQNWDTSGSTDILTHNLPFDVYSIKHSCGPNPTVCLQFDFYKGPTGEYSESAYYSVPIDGNNIRQKCDTLVEQYKKTASLTPFRVLMVPLGDDFRYYRDYEFDQQYRNYQRMFEFINANPDIYNVQVKFGTVTEYFNEISKYPKYAFPTLRGDFFPYADIFNRGVPDYWTGYYTTRPAAKILCKHLEANLRSAEILFTFAYNYARQIQNTTVQNFFREDYAKLSEARRNLALFQHHDAITGTSKVKVMADYELRLRKSIESSYNIQSYAIQNLLMGVTSDPRTRTKMIKPAKIPTDDFSENKRFIVFNSLTRDREDVIQSTVSTPYVRVVDTFGNVLRHQISPIWTVSYDAQTSRQTYSLNENQFEISFVVDLKALSLNIFYIETIPRATPNLFTSDVYCKGCLNVRSNVFVTNPIPRRDIRIENHKISLIVDGDSGFLRSIRRKYSDSVVTINTTFEGYANNYVGNGAYLFKTVNDWADTSENIFYKYPIDSLIVISGHIYSLIYVNFGNGLLSHKIKIYHLNGTLGDAIFLENVVDLSANRLEMQLCWRMFTDVKSGDEFYTDANGVSTQKRRSNPDLNIEANYYPIASSIFIQDGARRLTLLVDHAQGATSWKSGLLEVMLDRRILQDDARGLGEGIFDNQPVPMKYCLLFEDTVEQLVSTDARPSRNAYVKPSRLSNRLSDYLLYPSDVYVTEIPNEYAEYYERSLKGSLELITLPLPDDVHLINFKTRQDHDGRNSTLLQSAMMILHRRGYDCKIQDYPYDYEFDDMAFFPRTTFTHLQIKSLKITSLTGLRDINQLRSFDDVVLQPMGIATIDVNFA